MLYIQFFCAHKTGRKILEMLLIMLFDLQPLDVDVSTAVEGIISISVIAS
jgi:hypothetical protein